jgi:hypothetical protein
MRKLMLSTIAGIALCASPAHAMTVNQCLKQKMDEAHRLYPDTNPDENGDWHILTQSTLNYCQGIAIKAARAEYAKPRCRPSTNKNCVRDFVACMEGFDKYANQSAMIPVNCMEEARGPAQTIELPPKAEMDRLCSMAADEAKCAVALAKCAKKEAAERQRKYTASRWFGFSFFGDTPRDYGDAIAEQCQNKVFVTRTDYPPAAPATWGDNGATIPPMTAPPVAIMPSPPPPASVLPPPLGTIPRALSPNPLEKLQ